LSNKKHDDATQKSENAAKNELEPEQAELEQIELEQTDGADEPVEASEEDALALARDEIAELNDKLLRTHAEMDNLRKRTAREVEDARKFAVERFSTALLDVFDNLERALEVEEGNEAGLREGVKLTFDSWHAMMEKFQLNRIDAVGEKFDPHLHEALSQMPSDEPEGVVIAQHVAGYTLHGRLIRPAKVLVSSGKG